MKVFFTVEAQRYFELRSEPPAELKEADVCNVVLDFIERKAYFTWVPEDKSEPSSPQKEDNFEKAFELWWELECPVQSIETYNSLGHKKKFVVD